MEASVTEDGIPNTVSRKFRFALAHNLATSLLPPLPVDADDDDTTDDDGAFPNEKDGVADVEAGVGAAADDEDKLCPNENGTDGAAAVTGAGAAALPKENPVTPAAGAGAEAVVVAGACLAFLGIMIMIDHCLIPMYTVQSLVNERSDGWMQRNDAKKQ
jgi:hypothetical protein